MRSVVLRRHSFRAPGEAHLSPEGVARAERVGRRSGTFDRVVTSPKPRAQETARAMGFDVDALLDDLGELPEPIGRFLDREGPTTFEAHVGWTQTVQEVGEAARRLAARWATELGRVPDGGRLLMISHAGLIELGAAGAAPGPAVAWGRPLAPLEGVRLAREGDRWTRAEVLRLGDSPGSADGGADPGGHLGRGSGRVDRSKDSPGAIVL
jgi:broad specificity phosphatase PhoE